MAKIQTCRILICPKCGLDVIRLGQFGGYVNSQPTLICGCGTRVGNDGKAVEEQPAAQEKATAAHFGIRIT